ncbi:hypothetical protein POM88_038285 [Heracleum sosnowskyi]|uniref:RRM domain-containing protein n=1 Tax=Heracleum sosnowskyi TaxID=360622 RepID=A0AAD8HTW9_9APIA|nr:hypothetical protein POM88_038285 [Heracleum sosnowskyi]
MKELNYDHLKLDNFFSFRSDFGTNWKKMRKVDDLNKENIKVVSCVPNMSSATENRAASCTTFSVDASQLVNNSLTKSEVPGKKFSSPTFSPPNNNNRIYVSASNGSTPANLMQHGVLFKRSPMSNVEQSVERVPFSNITNQSSGQVSVTKMCKQSQNKSKGQHEFEAEKVSGSSTTNKLKAQYEFEAQKASGSSSTTNKLSKEGAPTLIVRFLIFINLGFGAKMAESPRKRYSRSPSPYDEQLRLPNSRSRSRSRSRSWSRPRERSRSRSVSRGRGRPTEVVNPGNTLYVTGLSTRVTERDLEDHFNKEGKVASCFLVVEPRSRISRGFAFITMDSLEDADRCIKHLNQSVLEGRYITVERSRRKRPRTPTPGHYLGLARDSSSRGERGDRGGRYRGGSGRDEYRRSPRRSPYRHGRDYSPPPRRSPYGGRSRRERTRSPPYSPYGGSPDRTYAHRSR